MQEKNPRVIFNVMYLSIWKQYTSAQIILFFFVVFRI
jgi:hypothetical protein